MRPFFFITSLGSQLIHEAWVMGGYRTHVHEGRNNTEEKNKFHASSCPLNGGATTTTRKECISTTPPPSTVDIQKYYNAGLMAIKRRECHRPQPEDKSVRGFRISRESSSCSLFCFTLAPPLGKVEFALYYSIWYNMTTEKKSGAVPKIFLWTSAFAPNH